jgi:hypothetical protein
MKGIERDNEEEETEGEIMRSERKGKGKESKNTK